MRFAVISNIQANFSALEAVLLAVDSYPQRIERIICAGDIVGLGPHPNEVLDLVRQRAIEAVRGNYDDAVAMERIGSGVDFPDTASEEADSAAIEWTRRNLTEENLGYLQELPRDLRLFRTGRVLVLIRNEMDRRQS